MTKDQLRETAIGQLPLDWNVVKLGELVQIRGRIGWKGLKKLEFGNNGVLIINGPEIVDGKVDWSRCQRVPQWRYDESPGISVKIGDILLTKDGTIGKVAYVEDLPEPATLASGIFLIRCGNQNNLLDRSYLYQYFNSPMFKSLVVSRTEGSVIPHLYQRDIAELFIPVPPVSKQKAIAKILSDLDEKIELNNQMNKTLDEIAQAIFKRWFIDFEFPNENGEPYKSSGGEMVYSELGLIPKGWEVRAISDVAKFLNGLPLQNYRPKDGENSLPVIKIKEMRQGITEDSEKSTIHIPKEFIVENGDVIFSWSGSLEVIIWSHGIGALNQHLFKVTSESYPKWFYYLWLNYFLPEYKRVARDKATTMGHIQRHHLDDSLLPVPNQNLMEFMDRTLSPISNKMIETRNESEKLSKIRGLLLPKLMTGKIRVPLEA